MQGQSFWVKGSFPLIHNNTKDEHLLFLCGSAQVPGAGAAVRSAAVAGRSLTLLDCNLRLFFIHK